MNKLAGLSEDERRRLFEIADAFIDRVPHGDAERIFQVVWKLEGVVNNGGFVEYFSGFAGPDASAAPRALRLLGAVTMAEIVECALHLIGAVDWNDDNAREQAVAALSAEQLEALGQLEDAFIGYPDGDTERLHWALIQANPTAFELEA